jgi:hypothetical protein
MSDLSERAIEEKIRRLLPTKPKWLINEFADILLNGERPKGLSRGQLKHRIAAALHKLRRKGFCDHKGMLWMDPSFA